MKKTFYGWYVALAYVVGFAAYIALIGFEASAG